MEEKKFASVLGLAVRFVILSRIQLLSVISEPIENALKSQTDHKKHDTSYRSSQSLQRNPPDKKQATQ